MASQYDCIHHSPLILGIAVLMSGTHASTIVHAAQPIRTLILSGESTPNAPATTPALRRILDDSGRFDVRICEAAAGTTAQSLSGFDLVVDNGAGLTAGSDAARAIAGFVRSGKGLVVAHGALGTSEAPTFWPVASSGHTAASVSFLDVVLARPEHPIVRGMARKFRTADAFPPGLASRPGVETIATATDLKGGPAIPAVVASQSVRGRVVCIALGYDDSAMHEPVFRSLFARAGEWAATGAVAPPPRPVPNRSADSVRGMILTGGHDHEAAFYSLFEGQADLGWLPVDTAANAFKKDVRGKYDVLIFYDFTRELDEACKKNLRDFVEAGKGVVVLHHALLNFQKWTWWSEDVAGGRYRLQREDGKPSSSVKDDQEIFVTPAVEAEARRHPVLRGIAPFHITDEAYKNLWMSDRNMPLLTTDNPTSDRNLAWIGPSKTSRVVAIQLGHGHSAFGHPAYRKLIHNAVLWAAGKSK